MVKGVKYYFIELPKFRAKEVDIENKLEQWLTFLDYKNMGAIKMAKEKNEAIKKAEEEYEYLTGEAEEKRWAELREKWARDEASMKDHAYHEGMEKGRDKEAMKIAKEMLKQNIEIEIIIKCTKLSKDEIVKLKEGNSND